MKFINYNYQKKSDRVLKIAQELKRTISIILQKDLNDSRINFTVTVSYVEVSHDLSYAKVFISYLDNFYNQFNQFTNKYTIESIISILQNASKYIRKILSQKIQLRKIPLLKFFYDNSLVKGIQLSKLIRNKNN